LDKWFIRNNKVDINKISKNMGINEIIAKLLANRGIVDSDSINKFLEPNLNKLYPAELMKDLVLTAEILGKDINNNKKIRIVGDYDVDGVMSVCLLYKGLKRLGADVDYVIPDRVLDGYGINLNIIKTAKEDGVDTIITCDNGISAKDAIEFAKDLGFTIVVTDHHDVPEVLPDANAIINPKQLDCSYPFKNLCGAGVVFKLISYLYKINGLAAEIYDFLEYVAIATICDVVDLIDENRIIVKYGLEKLNNTKNVGLKALIEACGILDKKIDVYHVGFIIGPSINASGRLDSALLALQLFLTEDSQLAKEIAIDLRDLNEERKKMTLDGIDKAEYQIKNSTLKDDKVLVIYEPKIHESIAGIIAGRIKERYNKPTIILTNGKDGQPKGSGRSIEEFNMYEELTKCKDILDKYGGHPMAAGLSLNVENIEELKRLLNDNISLTEDDLIPKIYIDMELPIEYINYKLIDDINGLEPFGKGNSKPIFGCKKLRITKGYLLGANKNVIKLNLLSPKGRRIDGLIFSEVEKFIEAMTDKYGEDQLENMYRGIENDVLVDILYYPSINEYKGNRSLQVIINNYRFN